ncbi:MAG TPA: SCO family protein [Gammaproteobacteria bacterium]|nr:SCO family protein [Gammaproteobacteria bacterium]
MPNARKPVDLRMVFLILALLASPMTAWPHDDDTTKSGATRFDESEALNFSQSAIGRRIRDYRFRDSGDREVRLSGYLGKPVIVSFVYTSCHHTCPLMTRRLSAAVDAARGVFGSNGFQVLTVGFDADADSPARMQAYARRHRVGDPGWAFLSADKETISAFTADLGFIFFPSPKGFDHLAQISIIDAEGRLYRQVYGDEFNPPAIIEPLKELAFGRRSETSLLADWVDGIRLFCTVYDPASGRYRFDYSVLVTAITGIISLGAIAVFLIHGWRQHRASHRSGI